jgi:hypothetical protein
MHGTCVLVTQTTDERSPCVAVACAGHLLSSLLLLLLLTCLCRYWVKVETAGGRHLRGPVSNAMGLSINFERLAVSAGEPIVVKVRCVNQADTYSVTASPVLVMDGTPPILKAFSLQSTGLGINGTLAACSYS